MVNSFRAWRSLERFLFLTPHDISKDKGENKLIATVTFDHEKGEVRIVREDEKEGENNGEI